MSLDDLDLMGSGARWAVRTNRLADEAEKMVH
jgi:hypothetical protein